MLILSIDNINNEENVNNIITNKDQLYCICSNNMYHNIGFKINVNDDDKHNIYLL